MRNNNCNCEDNCCPRVDDDICCIDTNRIYDSSRSQDCLENIRLLFTDVNQAIIEGCTNIRIKDIRVLWAQIETDELPFNNGYFQVNIRYYFYVTLGCCTDNVPQEAQGLAVYDKSTILYGGEGNVSIFRSDRFSGGCTVPDLSNISAGTNQPRVIVEVAEPVPLAVNVVETCNCSALPNEAVPEQIAAFFNGTFESCQSTTKNVFVSIGIFALIRIERPAQLIIPACDFCIPDADKSPVSLADPCSLFSSIPFPVNEFYPTTCSQNNNN